MLFAYALQILHVTFHRAAPLNGFVSAITRDMYEKMCVVHHKMYKAMNERSFIYTQRVHFSNIMYKMAEVN